MSTISIHEALAQMSDMGDKPFKIAFVRATGTKAGSIKECFAYYGAPNPKERTKPTTPGPNRKPRKLHIESGTVPLTDASDRKMITPMISHIIMFNNRKVIH